MTKEEARNILECYFNNMADRKFEIKLPITDEVVHQISHDSNMDVVFEQWSFKGLIKLAYDL